MLRATQSRRAQLLLAVLGFGSGALLALALHIGTQQSIVDNMSSARQPDDGLVDPTQHTSGIFPPEVAPDGTTFRWTGPRATLTFPYAANLGRHAHLTMRMAAPGDVDQSPRNVIVRLNGREALQVAAGPAMVEYQASLDTQETPNPYLEPSHIQVDLESETFISPYDGRELGVMLDEISLRPDSSRRHLALSALLWATLTGAVGWVAASRFPLRTATALMTCALFSFCALGATYLPRGIPPAIEIMIAGFAWLAAICLAPQRRPLIAVALALLLLWMVFAGRVFGDWQMDDAYISYRYAWNLLNGNGLIYNVGEIVEGYTNFAWTMLATFTLALHWSPSVVALAANIGLSAGLVAVTYQLSRQLWRSELVGLVAALLVSVDGAVLTYGARGSGMESIAFSFFLLLAAALIWTGRERASAGRLTAAGLVLALVILTRPEGFLVAVVFFTVYIWQVRDRGRSAWREVSALIVPCALVVLPYELWRISFYGYPFPNTFYAKTGANASVLARGWDYVLVYLGERWLLVGLALLALALALLSARFRLIGAAAACALLVVPYMLYLIWVGGDHFPGWRFAVPLTAPIALLAAGGIRAVFLILPGPQIRAVAQLALLFTGCAYVVSAFWLLEPKSVNAELTAIHAAYVNRWGSAGLWLRENTGNKASTAAKGAGAIAYYSQRPVIDVYGLNDLYIGHLQMPNMGTGNAGHDKHDPAYVLGRRPDYILDEWLNYFQPVKGRLKQEYEYLVARTPTGPELAWWKRRGNSGP